VNRPSHPTTTLVALTVTGLVLVGCAGREPGPAPAAPTPAPGDVTRYCSLVAEVNNIGERVFADMPEDAPPTEVGRRQGLLVEQAAAQLGEMQQVAPAQIRSDVAVFLTDLRARTTALQGPDPAAAQAAEERIRNFEAQNCELGPDGA
jgi:hypothetical protein